MQISGEAYGRLGRLTISGKSEEEESALSSDFFCPRANRMSFQRERERTRNDAAPVIRNFIWEGNESGGGRDWFSPLLFLFGYTEEAEGLEKNARMECARFFDESCDSWGEVLMKLC